MGVVRRDLKPGQSSLGPRLIGYGLIGIFCVPGPLGLLFALNLILHRAAFIHTALRTDGTVTWMEPVRTTRTGESRNRAHRCVHNALARITHRRHLGGRVV
jgi:hypothetical protein